MTDQQLFDKYCAGCHKQSGKGNFLAGIPANVRTQLDKESIMQLITKGLPAHEGMPILNDISPEQSEQIANYLLSMKIK
ncbi:MAG: cytochrome c [Halopseudomonas sp.]